VVGHGKRDRERERERPCHFVLSDHAMYVLVDKHPGVAPPEDDPYKNLGVAHAGPLDTVSSIDIGLDRQTIVVRFDGKVGDGGHPATCQPTEINEGFAVPIAISLAMGRAPEMILCCCSATVPFAPLSLPRSDARQCTECS